MADKKILSSILSGIAYLNTDQYLFAHDCLERAAALINKAHFDRFPERKNPFSLYSSREGWETPSEKIMNLVIKFTEDYNEIKKQHPKHGMGDTASDESITGILYEMIHYGKYMDDDE